MPKNKANQVPTWALYCTQVYYVYGFMLLVVLIMQVVVVCVTIVGTYFLLNAENYHWCVLAVVVIGGAQPPVVILRPRLMMIGGPQSCGFPATKCSRTCCSSQAMDVLWYVSLHSRLCLPLLSPLLPV